MNKVAYYNGVLGIYKKAGLQEEDLQRDALKIWNSLSLLDKEAIAKQVVVDMEADGSLVKVAGPMDWINKKVEGYMANRMKGAGGQVLNDMKGQASQMFQEYWPKIMPYLIGMGGGALAGGAMGGWKGALGGAALGGLGAYGYQRPETQNWIDKTVGNWNEKARGDHRSQVMTFGHAFKPPSSGMVPLSKDWRQQRAQENRDATAGNQQ